MSKGHPHSTLELFRGRYLNDGVSAPQPSYCYQSKLLTATIAYWRIELFHPSLADCGTILGDVGICGCAAKPAT